MSHIYKYQVELAVIIPVYNEEDVIGGILEKWLGQLRTLGINFILHVYNDGSTDGTRAILRNLAQNNKEIILYENPNCGHGPTILKGYRGADNAEWLFQIDSDNELGIGDFRGIWNRRNNYDLLIGQRIGRHNNLIRAVLSLASRITVGLFYAKGIIDVNSPYRLMRNQCFRSILNSMPENIFAPNIILSGVACLKKYRIFIYKIKCSKNTGSTSKDKIKLFKGGVRSFFEALHFRLFKIRY